MSGIAIAALGFAVMLGLIAIRMPIGLAMLVVGAAGYVHLSSANAFLAYMKTNTYYQFSNYTLSVIPLFILMGAIAERSGLSTALFRAGSALVGHLRGGMAMAVILACTGFGAICGSSVATTATFGRAALPEMLRAGYRRGFSTGVIAVGGTLGILIPPSVILVIYAISTEQNIKKLFQAALIPGLLAALFYCVVIAIMARYRPDVAPAIAHAKPGETRAALLRVWPVALVALVVVGGIYGGWFTPTEGAAVGSIAMIAVAILQRALGWQAFRDAILQTAETSGMIFLILLGAEVFNAFLAFTQLPSQAAQAIATAGLPPYAVLCVLLATYLVLGAVMDELAMILLTLPVFFPIVSALDFGTGPDGMPLMSAEDVAIWFGILVLIVVGIGLTAPPVGLNVFVIASIARNVPIRETYAGVFPFILADLARLGLVLAFPALALAMVRWLN